MDMKAKDIMTKDPACCVADTDLRSVAKMMCDCDCGMIPVVDSRETMVPVGTITDRDITCRSLGQGRNPLTMTAGDCMTPTPATVDMEAGIQECHRIMKEMQIRRLLVTDDDGRVRGIVSQADLVRNEPPDMAGDLLKEISKPAMAGVAR